MREHVVAAAGGRLQKIAYDAVGAAASGMARDTNMDHQIQKVKAYLINWSVRLRLIVSRLRPGYIQTLPSLHWRCLSSPRPLLTT